MTDSAFREAVMAEESLLVVFGAEFRGAQLKRWWSGD